MAHPLSIGMTRLARLLLCCAVLSQAACGGQPRDQAGGETFVARLPAEALEERAFMSQSVSFFEERLEEPPVVLEGQKLHPKLQYEFQEQAKRRAASEVDYNDWLFEIWSTAEGRQRLRDAVDVNWVKMAHDTGPVVATSDHRIDGPGGSLRLRSYRPKAAPPEQPLPGLLYFHGGGFLMASIEAVEPQAQILATEGNLVVVSVDYRLAPEHTFPAAHEDALAAYQWLVSNAEKLGIDPARIGVGGDSAGGNLAAVISDEQARRGGPVPKAQLLYYPFTDGDTARYESYHTFGEGFGLDQDFISRATRAFMRSPEDLQHRWLTLVDSVDFARQPPSVVATAGFDPIRDQGRRYAEKLAAAGVPVDYRHYPSLNHGFLEASATIDDARKACFETARLIGGLLRE